MIFTLYFVHPSTHHSAEHFIPLMNIFFRFFQIYINTYHVSITSSILICHRNLFLLYFSIETIALFFVYPAIRFHFFSNSFSSQPYIVTRSYAKKGAVVCLLCPWNNLILLSEWNYDNRSRFVPHNNTNTPSHTHAHTHTYKHTHTNTCKCTHTYTTFIEVEHKHWKLTHIDT